MKFRNVISGPIFCADAPDVVIETADAAGIDVRLSISGFVWQFALSPVAEQSGYVATIKTRDILEALIEPSSIDSGGVSGVPVVEISAGADTESSISMSFQALYGSAAGKTPADMARHWLTWRDQISTTYFGCRERLTFFAGLDLLGWKSGSYTVAVKIYTPSGIVQATLASGTIPSQVSYISVDASPASVLAVGEVSSLLAYDLSFSLSGSAADDTAATVESYPLRLVLGAADPRAKEFIYINSLGVEDRVTACGIRKDGLEGGSSKFVNGGVEREHGNDAQEQFEVYSGHLATARSVEQWMEFLKSSERHLYNAGLKGIVIDEYDTEAPEGELSSVSFTYRLSERIRGFHHDDSESIGDYDPKQKYGALIVGDIPDATTPAAEDLFFLKTRLDEFPLVSLSEDYLLLVQSPVSYHWGAASLDSVKNWIQKTIDHNGISLAAVWASLSKTVPDTYANELISEDHIPTLPQSKVTGLPDALSSLRAGYTGISALIPQAATADNQLADKEFVNSSIATATATFRGTFSTLAALEATPADRNDYAFWQHKDEAGNTCYDKYTYTGSEWKFEYRLNNSSFTAAQWGAINSGITGALVTKLSGIATGAQVNVIETVKLGGTALAVSGKAVDITGGGIKSALGISDWALAASKPSYTTAEVTEKTKLYFTDARAKSALSGHTGDTTIHITAAERKAWNAKWDWNEAAVKAVKVNAAGEADKLANSRKLWGNAFNGEADVDGDITLGSGKRIYFGSTSYYIELVNGRLHTNVGLYSDKFISARGSDPDAGGGSGASLPVVWASLQGNTDDYKDKTIHQAHIPTLPVSRIDGLATALAGKQAAITADNKLDYSLLKNTPTIGNGTITIKQGTNSQTFSTNQGDNKTITLTDTTYESKTAASGGTALSLVTTGEKYTWNNKQPAISDLATIRSNAATAFGWGDHSKAGYITPTNNTGQIYTLTTIDASTLDANTWYPVLLQLSYIGPLFHIEVTNALNTNVPSWATHQNGFTCKKVWEIYGSGWGAVPASIIRRTIYESLYAYCDVDPVRGIGQLSNSSNEVVFVRGGGKYIFACSRGVVPTLITTSTEISNQTIAPTTTAPAEIVRNNQLTTDSIAWNRLTGKPTTLGGYGIEDWIVKTSTASPDTLKTAGNYKVAIAGTSGNGYNFNYGQVLVLCATTDSNTIAQIAAPYDNNNLYFRSGTVSNFTDANHPWRTIYTSGNCNKSDVDWNAANLTVEKRVRIKNANVIAFLSTDAMPKERLLGPMSSYGYDLAWHNGAQWNKVYHSGNFIDGTNYISPKTTLVGYGITDASRIFRYTIPASGNKGVRITFTANEPVKITVSGSNQHAQLVLVGTGYGAGGFTRNNFTELVHSDTCYSWCMPDEACSVEVFSARTSSDYVTVESPSPVTFTAISALSKTAVGRRLLNSSNYSSFALPLTGGTMSGSIRMDGNTITPLLIRNYSSTAAGGWARAIVECRVDDKNAFGITPFGNYTPGAANNKIDHVSLGFAGYNGLNLRISETDIKWGNNAIYHAGNSNLPTVRWNCSSLVANGSVEAKAKLYGQCIEFSNIASSSGHGGFIDFHFNGSTEDYTSRIIESASGKLHLVASLVRIGNGPSVTFTMSGTSYDYIWTEYPDVALILGTATSLKNSGIYIKGKKVYIGGAESGNNALNVLGVAHATTGIYTDGYISARKQDTSSDIRLKTDFRPLNGALKYIRGTHFTRFRWKDGSGESVGIIAQEEQSREYGFLVRSHGEIGHLTYDYAASTALLGAALQEEDEKVEALKRRVKELENKLNKLKQSNYAR